MSRNFKSIGEDARIDDGAIIRHPDLCSVGSHVAIDPFVYISVAAEIGSYIHIAPFVSIIGGRAGKVVIEDFAGISAGCRIVCSTEDFMQGTGLTNPTIPPKYRGQVKTAPVVIGRHALIGTNAIILPGVHIGEGAVVGAGALVRKDLKPWTVYVGNPAKPLCERPRDRILQLEAQLLADVRANRNV